MRLYLIRHGESENNIKGCWTGWQDVALAPKGIEEAYCLGKYLQNVHFDKVYSSDLIRAAKTAETALPGYVCSQTELLREINVGSLSGEAFVDGALKYGEDLKENQRNSNFIPYGGENAEQFDVRLKKFMKMIENSGFENVAAFAHAGVLRRFGSIVTGNRFSAENVICKNCAVAIFEYTGSKWSLHSWINF